MKETRGSHESACVQECQHPSAVWPSQFILQFRCYFALSRSGANAGISKAALGDTQRGQAPPHSGSGHPWPDVPAAVSAPFPQHPRAPTKLLADLGTGSPLVRCCTTSPRGSRRYAVLFSMFWSSQHFLCYFNPKWGSHSSVRQLYSHWSSKEELRKFQPLSESQISDSFDVLKGILTHTRDDFSGEMNALVE